MGGLGGSSGRGRQGVKVEGSGSLGYSGVLLRIRHFLGLIGLGAAWSLRARHRFKIRVKLSLVLWCVFSFGA